jgi:hypothetical protein
VGDHPHGGIGWGPAQSYPRVGLSFKCTIPRSCARGRSLPVEGNGRQRRVVAAGTSGPQRRPPQLRARLRPGNAVGDFDHGLVEIAEKPVRVRDLRGGRTYVSQRPAPVRCFMAHGHNVQQACGATLMKPDASGGQSRASWVSVKCKIVWGRRRTGLGSQVPEGGPRATAAGLLKVSAVVLGRTLEFPWASTGNRGVSRGIAPRCPSYFPMSAGNPDSVLKGTESAPRTFRTAGSGRTPPRAPDPATPCLSCA